MYMYRPLNSSRTWPRYRCKRRQRKLSSVLIMAKLLGDCYEN